MILIIRMKRVQYVNKNFFIAKNSLQNNIFVIITVLFLNYLFTTLKDNMYFKILYFK